MSSRSASAQGEPTETPEQASSRDAGVGFAGARAAVATGCAVVPALVASLRGGFDGAAFAILFGASALIAGVPAGLLGARAISWRPILVVWVTLFLAAPPLSVFGRVLKTATHHRPLGGVTFALLAAILVLGLLALVRRVVQVWVQPGAERKLWLLLAGSALLALPAAWPVLADGSGRAAALDTILLLVAAIAGTAAPLPDNFVAKLRKVGPILCFVAFVCALGLALADSAALGRAVSKSPVILGLLSSFAG